MNIEHKEFPHVDNPQKGLCVLFNAMEKAAHYIWLLPWATCTHTDVIFPTAPSPSLFLSFSLPSALSLDWIAPWSQAPVAMWCCCVPCPPPASRLDPLLGSGSGLIDVRQPYITAQLPSPAGGFSHAIHPDQSERPLLCTLITVWATQKRTYTTASALELWMSLLLTFNPPQQPHT